MSSKFANYFQGIPSRVCILVVYGESPIEGNGTLLKLPPPSSCAFSSHNESAGALVVVVGLGEGDTVVGA